MAGQFHVAFSGSLVGAAIVAGGPYDCAEGALAFALQRCMATNLGAPDPGRLLARAGDRAGRGEIDPLAGLAADRVYVFSGTHDTTVTPPVVATVADFYRAGRGAGGADRRRRRHGRRARLHHRGRGQRLRGDRPAVRQRLRLRPGRGDPRRRSTARSSRRRRRRPAGSSSSTRASSSPTRRRTGWRRPASPTCRPAARPAAAACTSSSTAASRPRRWSATRSSRGVGFNRWADTQRPDRALPADPRDRREPERLLGLVGLRRRGLRHQGRPADGGGQGAWSTGWPGGRRRQDHAFCGRFEASNLGHWQAGRARVCDWWFVCAVGSGERLGLPVSATTLFEHPPGSFSTTACAA